MKDRMRDIQSFKPLDMGRTLTALVLLLTVLVPSALAWFGQEGENAADLPQAESFLLVTYENISAQGRLIGSDPKGTALTFQVTRHPARGKLIQEAPGSIRFTYTPYEDKTGKDSFTYVVRAEDGRTSPPVKVRIVIRKPKTQVTYADLTGHPAHRAALALAERDIFVGEQMGETWLFHPEVQVTREEFVTLAMAACGQPQTGAETGFADEDRISVWARPYVGTALRTGAIRGRGVTQAGAVFVPDRPITGTEAAVLLDRLLGGADQPDRGVLPPKAAPAWAYQSVVNLERSGVVAAAGLTAERLNAPLDRGRAAELLLQAGHLLEQKGQSRS